MKQEYIKGDIVMYNNKIHTIMDILGVNNYELSYIEHPVHQLELSGVSITTEILEKNGWKRNGGQYSFTFKPYVGYKVELIGFFVEMFKDVHDMLKHRYFQITHENKVICGCFYVHELQHLLFGLGLNPETEV